MMVLLQFLVALVSYRLGEGRRTSAKEQKRNKPRPTEPPWTNLTHRFRAQNAAARALQHGSELSSPVRDEEAAGSNPVTPTSATVR